MKYYHAPIDVVPTSASDQEAERIAREITPTINTLGGHVEVGRTFGEGPAILVVTLPDDASLPSDLGVDFHQVHQTHFPAQPDQGIQEVPGEG